MESGIYIVEEKGSGNRELVKIHRNGEVMIINDPDAFWDEEILLDCYFIVCKLDLNSF